MDPERLRNRDIDLDQLRDELHALVRTEIQKSMAEHERRDHQRYDTLRDGQAKIQRTVDDMNGKVGRVNAEIGYGLPEPAERGDRPTLRDRLHVLENDDLVAKAIHDSYARTFGRWQKIGLFGFAAAAAVEGFLRIVGVGG